MCKVHVEVSHDKMLASSAYIDEVMWEMMS